MKATEKRSDCSQAQRRICNGNAHQRGNRLMAKYKITTENSGYILEEHIMVDESTGTDLQFTIYWKYGSVVLELDEDELEEINEREEEPIFLEEYDVEKREFLKGTEEITAPPGNPNFELSEEQIEEIKEACAENGFTGLQELGFESVEYDAYIHGAVTIEELEETS